MYIDAACYRAIILVLMLVRPIRMYNCGDGPVVHRSSQVIPGDWPSRIYKHSVLQRDGRLDAFTDNLCSLVIVVGHAKH